jgi:hypothetical protein
LHQAHQPRFSVRLAFHVGNVHIHRLMDLREEDARYIGLSQLTPITINTTTQGTETPVWITLA